MILRAIILLGWEKTETPGPNPVKCLYCGLDGIALAEEHKAARDSGKYVAFRKIINPSGIPMPMVIDPPRKPIVFLQPETTKHEPSLNKKLEANKAANEAAAKVAADKKAAEDKANAEKQAIADAAVAREKRFTALNAKSKSDLLVDVQEYNETESDENKIKLAPDAKKADVIEALMKTNIVL